MVEGHGPIEDCRRALGIGIQYEGTSLISKRPPPEDHPRTQGKGLRQDPRGVHFLMSEVHLSDMWRNIGEQEEGFRNTTDPHGCLKTSRNLAQDS